MPNIIYVLTNPALEGLGLIKIGKTTNLVERLRSLSGSTSIPAPFEVYYSCEIRDEFRLDEVERNMHFVFGPDRYNDRREFFRTDPERVKIALHPYAKPETEQDVGPPEYEREMAEEFQPSRSERPRPRFRFDLIGVPPGSVLTFFRDPTITALVHDETRIEFQGEVTTVSKAANLVFHERYGKKHWGGNGAMAWRYDGELLWDRRLRLEESET
jgi:hypothetical protein